MKRKTCPTAKYIKNIIILSEIRRTGTGMHSRVQFESEHLSLKCCAFHKHTSNAKHTRRNRIRKYRSNYISLLVTAYSSGLSTIRLRPIPIPISIPNRHKNLYHPFLHRSRPVVVSVRLRPNFLTLIRNQSLIVIINLEC